MNHGGMSSAPRSALGISGMTLIEILVALSVSTMVLTIALSIYFTFSGSLLRIGDPQHQATTIAIDSLRHDLAASVQAAFTNDPTFELTAEPIGLEGRFRSTLTFHTAHSPPGDQGLPQMTISRLCYGVQDDSTNPAGASLVRESVTLWGPEAMAPPVSNTALHGIAEFQVSVLDRNGWTNRWKSTPGHLVPRAARIKLDWTGAHTTETASLVVFIPAGNSIAAPARQSEPVTGQTTPSPAGTAAPTPTPARATGSTGPGDPP